MSSLEELDAMERRDRDDKDNKDRKDGNDKSDDKPSGDADQDMKDAEEESILDDEVRPHDHSCKPYRSLTQTAPTDLAARYAGHPEPQATTRERCQNHEVRVPTFTT